MLALLIKSKTILLAGVLEMKNLDSVHHLPSLSVIDNVNSWCIATVTNSTERKGRMRHNIADFAGTFLVKYLRHAFWEVDAAVDATCSTPHEGFTDRINYGGRPVIIARVKKTFAACRPSTTTVYKFQFQLATGKPRLSPRLDALSTT